MKEHLDQIRQLLDELEQRMPAGAISEAGRDFSALELPLIIQEIVDDLQPLLTPYEAAFYWYMFRHSIAADGKPLIRVGQKELRQKVIKQARNYESEVSRSQVQTCLQALEKIGAIRKEGEPNRDGTPYRILIPDEIEACRKFRAERMKASARPDMSENDLDYYNIRENRIKVFERDSYKCRYCDKQLTRFTATLDHVKPVSEGGDNSFDNLQTACLNCNSRKNRKAVGHFLADQAG